MIRFVDVRQADIAGIRFSYWDTVTDEYINLEGSEGWDTWQDVVTDFQGSFEEEIYGPGFLERLKGLSPEWVYHE